MIINCINDGRSLIMSGTFSLHNSNSCPSLINFHFSVLILTLTLQWTTHLEGDVRVTDFFHDHEGVVLRISDYYFVSPARLEQEVSEEIFPMNTQAGRQLNSSAES